MIALLIIDMQKGMFTKEMPRYDSEHTIERINQIVEKIREKNGHVIFIQHDGNASEGYEPYSDGWELIQEIPRDEHDVIIHKTSCDAFYNSKLDKYLHEHSIKTIIITGCATDYCVDTTIRVATSKDYSIIVPNDGHTTADRPFLKAEDVIRHHNWIWENLILPRKNLKVISTTEVLNILENIHF
jgi:nicotinamidase-related amidase